MNDRIEKRIELKAPLSRVWRALTDYREFGQWFGAKLDAPLYWARFRVARLPIPATSICNGRPWCRK